MRHPKLPKAVQALSRADRRRLVTWIDDLVEVTIACVENRTNRRHRKRFARLEDQLTTLAHRKDKDE